MAASHPNFAGPWCHNMKELQDVISTVPESYRAVFTDMSNTAGKAICETDSLHVWETNGELDALVLLAMKLTQVANLRSYQYDPHSQLHRVVPAGTVIVVQDVGHDFDRICTLVSHILKDEAPKARFEGKVKVFKTIAVVVGVDPSKKAGEDGNYQDSAQQEALAAVNRITKTIVKIAEITWKHSLVWHHGPIVHFLNFFIKSTIPLVRENLKAVTIHSLLTVNENYWLPTALGEENSMSDMSRFQDYLMRLKISAVLLDTTTQHLQGKRVNEVITSIGRYFPAILPVSLWTPMVHKSMDQLCRFWYSLLGAVAKRYTSETVAEIKNTLDPSYARLWIDKAIEADWYQEEISERFKSVELLQEAYWIADAPLIHTNSSIFALSRCSVGPAEETYKTFICPPLEINWDSFKTRISSTSPFRFWIPVGTDQHAMLSRISSMFNDAVRQGQGTSRFVGTVHLEPEVKEMWKAFAKPMEKAIVEGLEKNEEVPEGLKMAIRNARRMLTLGSFGRLVALPLE